MKRQLSHTMVALLATAALLTGAAAQAAPPPSALLGYQGGDNNNPHNLSSRSQNNVRASSETQICIFCHTPHGATPQSTLWNRLPPAEMGNFPLYDRTTVAIDDDPGIVDVTKYKADGSLGEYPNGATKLCLSCHDGATAIGTMTNKTIDMTYATLNDWGNANVILDPSVFNRTHPVSFVYSPPGNPNQVVLYIESQKPTEDYELPTSPNVRLDGEGRMQCTTCHNPHWDTNNGSTYTLPFWANYGAGADENEDYDLTCVECHRDNSQAGRGDPHNF